MRGRGVVEGDGVVGPVPRDAGYIAIDRSHQRDAGHRVGGRCIGQRLSDDPTRPIHPEMKFSPTTFVVTTVFRRRPLTLAEHRQPGAIDDEMQPPIPWWLADGDIEMLPAPGERRVIGRWQVEAPQPEQRRQKALGLAEREVEDEAQRQGCFDGDI